MEKQTARGSRRTAAQMHALAAVRRDIHSRDSIRKCKYLREFSDAFRKYDSVLSPEEFDKTIADAQILLVGDYHALPASQRFAAELLEKCARERSVVLAVEAVLARDQQILDAWWRREIVEDELRRRLRFDRDWGYSWAPFYSLLNSARDCADGIYGLDCLPRNDLRRIRSRDQHAAAKLFEIRERHPRSAILALFGESHMAPQHLPRAVRECMPQERILTVLQNVDCLYWQAIAEGATSVCIGEDTICIFNSSPLEKYESYRLCLDHWNAPNDEQPDFAPAIYNLIFSLARSLGFRLDSPHNGTQPKFLADALPEVIAVPADSPSEDSKLKEKSCVYLPQANSFLIREFQIGEAAEECTRFLHFACRGMTQASANIEVIENTLARFGSRLLLPEQEAEKEAGLGDSLYNAYLANRISQPAIRRMFMAHLETDDHTKILVAQLKDAAKS